jgi:hypothetical protein
VEKPRDVIVLLAPTKTSTITFDQMGELENDLGYPIFYSFLQKIQKEDYA